MQSLTCLLPFSRELAQEVGVNLLLELHCGTLSIWNVYFGVSFVSGSWWKYPFRSFCHNDLCLFEKRLSQFSKTLGCCLFELCDFHPMPWCSSVFHFLLSTIAQTWLHWIMAKSGAYCPSTTACLSRKMPNTAFKRFVGKMCQQFNYGPVYTIVYICK